MTRAETIRSSMLWAAYGDALGFITELTDEAGVRRRTGEGTVHALIPWRRKIGGRLGVMAELPAGCYSDDTQLRLATCRAIRSDGVFDVEAFSKVELPIWRAYAFGAGRGTKAAAQALLRPGVQWCNNFYQAGRSRYTESGGNGAAMRIQAHVWAAPERASDKDVVAQIVRNAVTTHGHPRGIVGAAFHGLCLRQAMLSGKATEPRAWKDIVFKLAMIAGIVEEDDDLGTIWLPVWEKKIGRPFAEAIQETLAEVGGEIETIKQTHSAAGGRQSREASYRAAAEAMGAFDDSSRGSGTRTSLLASYLAWRFDGDPLEGLQACVNLLHTDTDTIATMAGALFGAARLGCPPQEVMDQHYLAGEASRLYSVSEGEATKDYAYPDLLHWRAPDREVDCVGIDGDVWKIAGLGRADPVGRVIEKRGRIPVIWQWLELSFGQKVFMKRRPEVAQMRAELLPFSDTKRQGDRCGVSGEGKRAGDKRPEVLSVDEATDEVIRSGFDPGLAGSLLMRIASEKDGVERAVAFAAIVAKAKLARLKRKGNIRQ